ncbi:basic salivary proline-rich protein 1-like [Myiozetetes cayanensis]|uniref:basic salivary proline-rich protein 1-like n=1 Tax=Myiozetetes cayanensis TaxID=478635 RepID=UPI00215DE58B|nr:basic salivary proline-rich protein 1-like [Myiozetetes cayanensis]
MAIPPRAGDTPRRSTRGMAITRGDGNTLGMRNGESPRGTNRGWGYSEFGAPQGWRYPEAGAVAGPVMPPGTGAPLGATHSPAGTIGTRAPPAHEESPGSPQPPNTPMSGGPSALEPPSPARPPGMPRGDTPEAQWGCRLPPPASPASSPQPPAPPTPGSPYRVGRRRRARTAGCALRPRGKCGCDAAELRDRRGGTGQDQPPGPPPAAPAPPDTIPRQGRALLPPPQPASTPALVGTPG